MKDEQSNTTNEFQKFNERAHGAYRRWRVRYPESLHPGYQKPATGYNPLNPKFTVLSLNFNAPLTQDLVVAYLDMQEKYPRTCFMSIVPIIDDVPRHNDVDVEFQAVTPIAS